LDSAYTQEVSGDYVYKTGIPTATQSAAGQLALPQAAFSICVGGLDDSATQTDGIDDAPTSGTIVIVGTPGAAVAITQDALRGGIVAYAGAMTVTPLTINTTIGAAVAETITTPTVAKTTAAPAIAGRVNAVRSETFVASGAVSSLGHTLEYQFNWGDGTALVWGPATQTHTFATATTSAWTTNVTVTARCAADTAVVSAASAAIVETGEAVKSTATMYADWATWNRPNCWAFQRQCRGDINGIKNTFWVQGADLTIFRAAFNKTDAVLSTVVVSGTPGVCADLNHTKNTFRVQGADLTTFRSYFNKVDASTPVCPNADYNFWTN